jgi:hypothetical protein
VSMENINDVTTPSTERKRDPPLIDKLGSTFLNSGQAIRAQIEEGQQDDGRRKRRIDSRMNTWSAHC